ncbi:MAG: phenylalanine--tRNA ligase subunit beta, partial [Rickettsiales bacterium]|nr:phenylalanine--tRNA ligase subunit beta [Rickettsiales bacterium]
MKFTLSWLKEFLDTDASLEVILETLTDIGLEVEEVIDNAEIYAPFKVARIESAEPHPDATKLQVCQVNDGEESIQIVCGAPNARAGIHVVLAPVGTIIPTNDLKIKASKIRGVESKGMLCSETELGLGTDSDGIMELPDHAKAGEAFAEFQGLTDPVIEIAITPNRGDCLGVYGIARDLAAAGIGTLKAYYVKEQASDYDSPILVSIEHDEACPFFVGRYFKDVTNTESPAWLQNRLKLIGLNPISTLVDITNYINFTFGRPLHVYDADKLSGTLLVRKAREKEAIDALNDHSYELDADDVVIADEKQAQAIAGVIGGQASSCEMDTTNIFLEVALFDAAIVAKVGRKHQIITDSRYRFERNVDPAFLIAAAHLASQMITDLCGGTPSHLVIAGSEPDAKRVIQFDPALVKTRGGVDLDADKIETILVDLGFKVTASDEKKHVTVPSWRSDVEGEVDLVEEVLRIYGYDKIPAIKLEADNDFAGSKLTDLQHKILKSRHMLSKMGFSETVTWSFMSAEKAKLFGYDAEKGLRLLNPISSELDVMRPSVLPNMLDAVRRNNSRNFENVGLFEVGPIFTTPTPDGKTETITAVRSGNNAAKNIYSKQEAIDVFDAKSYAFEVLEVAGCPTANLRITRDAPSYYHPGRSGAMKLGKNVIGYFGELHPAVLDQFDIKNATVAFELFVEAIPGAKAKKSHARAKYDVSDYQPVERDFAFVVDQDLEVHDLLKAIRNADK